MSDLNQAIDRFLGARRFAVAGASEDSFKYGHMCFAALLRRGATVYPVNPRAKSVLGVTAYPTLAALPEPVESLAIATQPAVTERLFTDALAAGIPNVWILDGGEPDDDALEPLRKAGVNLIHGGPCLLMALNRRRR